MSNVYKFTKTTHKCKSAKEAESFFPLLAEGAAKCIHVVRIDKKWVVTVERWKAERMTDEEVTTLASSLMDQAVANMRKEYSHVF
jgi:hypothetical protein